MHPIGCGLGLAGGCENRTWVILEHAQPGRDVGGVIGPWMMGDTEIREDERCGKFGANLLDREAVALEPFGEVAVEPVLCASGVTTFVQQCAHVGRRVAECGKGRHENLVEIDPVMRVVCPLGDRNLQCRNERLGVREPFALGQDRDRCRLVAFHLSEVEHGERAGEHAPGAGFALIMIIVGARCSLLPEYDRGAVLPFANLRTESRPLTVYSATIWVRGQRLSG